MKKKEKFRVAVLLTGQLRTWEVCKLGIRGYFDNGVKNMYNGWTRDFETDYFLHTWDINSWRNTKEPHGFPEAFDIEKIPEDSKQKLKDFYNPKSIEIEKFEDFGHPWLPMFYSFTKANQAKRNYEIQNNFVYDLVIKTRFDTLFVLPEDRKSQVPMTILKPDSDYGSRTAWSIAPELTKRFDEFNYFTFHDVAWYSDSGTMDMISNIYFDVKNGEKNPWKNTYGPGTIIYDFCVRNSIKPTTMYDVSTMVARKDSLDAGLKWPKDSELICKHAHDFHACAV